MTSALSIYDSEQYLFEIAQNFIRSRIIFSSIELEIFDLLLLHKNGLTCSNIAKKLKLHFIENESRCLQDILDALTSMQFLERTNNPSIYKLTDFTRDYLLPNQTILSAVDKEFYKNMPKLDERILNNSSKDVIYKLMLLRIQNIINLNNYSNISIDSINDNSDVIIIWQEINLLKENIQKIYDILPSNGKGLLILILPEENNDEVTLAMNIFMNMMIINDDETYSKEIYSEIFLQQIGFRSIQTLSTINDIQLLLAYK